MTSPRVLVVDDEADLRELLEITLVRMGLDVDSAETLREARAFLAQNDYGLILTDMRLPDGLGLELVQEVNASNKSTPIAVVTAYGSAENAVVALKAGAFDYVSKPVVLDDLRVMVQSALRLSAPSTQTGSPAAAGTASRLIGESAVMQSLRNQIERLARSMAPIAITGESGSGKELVAREIHARSSRAGKPFIAVNCGAIPEALMEAEFFGYRKGAFTGAADERDGFFHAANGGTLMLDEVADLPLAMQVKLLRAIQERRVRKIGATSEEPVDVRIISATHQNLAQCVETGKFRQDLFYRLNVIELSVPPLRERLDDLGVLVDGMLARLAGPGQKAALGPQVLETLSTYSFPGNVRELENVLERALAFANDGVIEVGDLSLKGARVAERPAPAAEAVVAPVPAAVQAAMAPHTAAAPVSASGPAELPSNLPNYLEQVEREIILRALTQTQFNRTQAALLLGISFRQLRYQMQKLDIQEPEG
ncbi:sigma-54-dependent Fis family transcriptional regulator [Massilia violaceinigra]|uniref:Sigma-54-dependent Fis family transcriptional regulator n=1 Tax=Massilia violaceinigra TaxID=2045208 RepID=A0A2D2DJS8_9BURK|nr:sigma-54 dependent transcriptional regulator [Massilia violaceinigra]ATQ75222.1 sigma-54-dependent Fis family transcriptional regulator [Massilia violaceinigra]